MISPAVLYRSRQTHRSVEVYLVASVQWLARRSLTAVQALGAIPAPALAQALLLRTAASSPQLRERAMPSVTLGPAGSWPRSISCISRWRHRTPRRSRTERPASPLRRVSSFRAPLDRAVLAGKRKPRTSRRSPQRKASSSCSPIARCEIALRASNAIEVKFRALCLSLRLNASSKTSRQRSIMVLTRP